MARLRRNPKVGTRSARAALAARREPYWTTITAGHAIGYRKGTKAGKWIARHYSPGRTPRLRYAVLGTADDIADADGRTILNFAQAQEASRAWFARARRAADGEPMDDRPYTVAMALNDYMADYKVRSGKALDQNNTAIKSHILPVLGHVELEKLTRHHVRTWLNTIKSAPARIRTRPGRKQRHKRAPSDLDQERERERCRKASANRVFTMLKAALNFAKAEGLTGATGDAWREVKSFRNVDAPRVRFLDIDEQVRLVNACHPPDFRRLVQAALFSGARYGELKVLRIADYYGATGRLHIRAHSKTSKARDIALPAEARDFFASITAGRASGDLMLPRPDGTAWGKNHQARPMALACKAARIEPAISIHILRHCYGSTLARAGVPMRVIADQMGHASVRTTERHYAHLAPSHVADTIDAMAPKLGIAEPGNVKKIRGSQAG